VKPPLIIERPDLQSARQRTLYGLLTLVFWALWFYLWVPLLALLAWALGVQQAFKYMAVVGSYHQMAKVLGDYGLVILLFGGSLLLWAGYNIMRFSGVERRAAPMPVSAGEITRYFGTDQSDLADWYHERCLVVTHDEHGQIARVVATSPLRQPSA
jgi:biofilm PGA synthesis protein PgaD